MDRDLDEIERQLDGSEPYYLRALIAELRQRRGQVADLKSEANTWFERYLRASAASCAPETK